MFESLTDKLNAIKGIQEWTPISSVTVGCVHCGTTALYTGTIEEINLAQIEFFKLHDDKNHQRKRVGIYGQPTP
jgi:hypothetical protein